MTMLNVGGAFWLLLVAWQQMLASPSNVDCRHPDGCRWLHPCRGSTPLDLKMVIMDTPDRLPEFNELAALDRLSSRASMLTTEIKSVIDHYVERRLGEQAARAIDVSGLEGISNVELTPNIHHAYERFARIAIFLAQMIKDENETTTENVPFEEHFQKLDDHLYHILCTLSQIIKHLEKPLSSEVIRGIANLRVYKAETKSQRHHRDYMVLRNFEITAETFSRDVDMNLYEIGFFSDC